MKTILVTGDAGPDFDIYLHFDGPNPPPNCPPTRIRCSLGGAGLAHHILAAWAGKAGAASIGFASPPANVSPTFAVWNPQALGKAFRPNDDKAKVWRVARSTNPGEVFRNFAMPRTRKPAAAPNTFVPEVILLVDNASEFRHPRGRVLAHEKTWGNPSTFIVWKMSPPFCRGELWWRAVKAGVTQRTVAVLSVEHLRLEAVRISSRISWEQTALDIAHELETNPALADLHAVAHVIVTIHGEGALWRRSGNGKSEYTLVFDPAHMEGEWWRSAGGKGGAYGYSNVFAATMAAACAEASPDLCGAFRCAIPRGLLAMRALRAQGHGAVGKNHRKKDIVPAFPAELVASVIRDDKKAFESLERDAFGSFASIEVPTDQIVAGQSNWRIALSADTRPVSEPLYGLARRVAVFGERELRTVPHSRFGKLLTADRSEIEALRNLQTLIEEYRKGKESKPLSLAVFGPPGAGKSFGVKEIAKEILRDDGAVLEFNLSQFDDGDLAGAFHQVRDKVLEGKMPVVFWDEFDSCEYKWLRLLLAPMNDGKFQEGQLTHPLGRCIFVFAGGTSHSLEHFGLAEPPPDAAPDSDEVKAWNQFKLDKGPDFLSRIHGSLNVLGPNRRREPKSTQNGPANQHRGGVDVSFPLRRAILLRALLGIKPQQRLEMDSGLLSALLEVGEYSNGSRSFEKICTVLREGGKQRQRYMPSDLPTDAVLAMNVKNIQEFKELLVRDARFQHLAEKLAPAIHRSYLSLADRNNPNAVPYEQLSEETKEDNLAAARRIPWLLGLVGLYVTDKPAGQVLSKVQVLAILGEPHTLDLLAEEEHDLWVEHKMQNGWIPGERDNDRHIHNLLGPYKQLAKEQKAKDQENILGIPDRVELAGFKIVASNPELSAQASTT